MTDEFDSELDRVRQRADERDQEHANELERMREEHDVHRRAMDDERDRVRRELSDLHDLLEQRAYRQADIRELLGRIRDTIPAPPPPPQDAPTEHAPVDVDALADEPEHAHDQP